MAIWAHATSHYVIAGGSLYETDSAGKYNDLGGGWQDVDGIAALGGKIYAISDGTLYAAETK